MTTDPTRIPITRSVSYAVRGAPEMPAHGAAVPGTTLAPTQVTFTYRAAPDSQLGRVQARVRGFWRRDGSRVNPGQPMAQHYFGDPSGWPEWLAEEARLHDPDAHPAVGPAPATDQAALRRIAELESSCRDVDRLRRDWVEMRDRAEALDARVQALTTAVLPAPADRAAVLREAESALRAEAKRMTGEFNDSDILHEDGPAASVATWKRAADLLRRMADETPQPTEAHPSEHTWAAELHDPLADEWVPGTRYIARDRAVNALTHARAIGPTWKDGTPGERRLVRATTTYTVEAASAVAQPDEETSRG